MVFQFFKNHSDNRKVNKNIEKIAVGSVNTRIEDINFIPRATGTTGTITCSSEISNYPAWGAFNATINNNWNSPDNPPTYNKCWFSASDDETPYIQIELSKPRIITNVSFTCGSDYAGDFVCNMTISASSDGINFDTLKTEEITARLNTGTLLNFTINSENEYKYIRLTFDRPLSNPYNPSMGICGINANSFHYEQIPTYNINVIYKDDETKDTPTLEMTYSAALIHANYAYCVDTGYYFYLSEPTLAAQRLFFNCEVDLLMTYKDDILKLGCIIDRQEYEFNAYLVDDKAPILNRRVVNTLKFPVGFSNNDSYILATTGI